VELLKRIFRRSRQSDTVDVMRDRMGAFRSLVERNNRVLELIADAGEKLGGEFIFDSQYLKTLTTQLQQGVRGVVYDLGALTGNAYPDLIHTFQRIQTEVQEVIDARVVIPKADIILPLNRIREELADAVGQKMARLAEIKNRLGCEIPAGFVLTTSACRDYFSLSGILSILEEWPGFEASGEMQLQENARQLQSTIMTAPIPRKIQKPLHAALKKLRKERDCSTLALRSSALDEDGELSFAGLYATRLGVPFEEAESAFREVVASLFSPTAMMYRRDAGIHPARAMMAVGFQCLIDARCAGVLYTLDPTNPDQDRMVITAALGLGKPVVDGTAAVDRVVLTRNTPCTIVSQSVAEKQEMLVSLPGGGVRTVAVPTDQRLTPCLDEEDIDRLARTALRVERYMKQVQDMEWAIDHQGNLFILQSRPLRISAPRRAVPKPHGELTAHHRVVMRDRGTVACRGIGSGPVVVVGEDFQPENIPQGAVLVARASSPRLSAAILKAGAVITDLGTPTSHLATIAREFRVPMIVGTQEATHIFQGIADATVDAEDNVIYEGIIPQLVREQLLSLSVFEEAREFRLLRRILNKVAPLYLSDPQANTFKAENCKTYHDIIRFAHEKAVQCLTEGTNVDMSRAAGFARQLDLDVPLDLIVLDLGGGLRSAEDRSTVHFEDVVSAPLRPLLEGLLAPGVWSRDPVEMDLDGFMASATRGAMSSAAAITPQRNLAVVSNSYLHLNLKLGYHFNIVDCYLTEESNDNFIYFRFAGGVTEMMRRSRRAQVLSAILERHDFVVERKGDLVVGRVKKLILSEMEIRLCMIGKLIGFTRQLDISLRDDAAVEYCIHRFMEQFK
jgi:pyruvate,water dikinase